MLRKTFASLRNPGIYPCDLIDDVAQFQVADRRRRYQIIVVVVIAFILSGLIAPLTVYSIQTFILRAAGIAILCGIVIGLLQYDWQLTSSRLVIFSA
jgi:hypothetical protein